MFTVNMASSLAAGSMFVNLEAKISRWPLLTAPIFPQTVSISPVCSLRRCNTYQLCHNELVWK